MTDGKTESCRACEGKGHDLHGYCTDCLGRGEIPILGAPTVTTPTGP